MVPEMSTVTDFLSSWAIFALLPTPLPTTTPPQTAPKIKISKKLKKRKDISSFYRSVLKIMIIGYTVPETWHMTDVIVIFHLGLFFALLTP